MSIFEFLFNCNLQSPAFGCNIKVLYWLLCKDVSILSTFGGEKFVLDLDTFETDAAKVTPSACSLLIALRNHLRVGKAHVVSISSFFV